MSSHYVQTKNHLVLLPQNQISKPGVILAWKRTLLQFVVWNSKTKNYDFPQKWKFLDSTGGKEMGALRFPGLTLIISPF